MNLFFRPIVSAATCNAITAGDAQSYLHQSNLDPLNVTLHQQWLFTDDGQNVELLRGGVAPHVILNRTSSYAIDVVGGVFGDPKSLQTYPLSANGNQLWDWNDDPSGNHVIQGHGEPFVVDIPNGDPMADLQVYDPNGGPNQQWTSPGLTRQLISAYKVSSLASAILLAGVATLLAIPAGAVPTFTVQPERLTTEVIEDDGASIKFTVTNTGDAFFTVTDVRLVQSSAAHSIRFEGGDLLDEVYEVFLQGVENCIGIKLGIAGTCSFREFVQTRDEAPSFSGTNFGLWIVSNIVQVDDQLGSGAAFVKVLDCQINDQSSPIQAAQADQCSVPEPATALLCGVGIVAMAAARRRLRLR